MNTVTKGVKTWEVWHYFMNFAYYTLKFKHWRHFSHVLLSEFFITELLLNSVHSSLTMIYESMIYDTLNFLGCHNLLKPLRFWVWYYFLLNVYWIVYKTCSPGSLYTAMVHCYLCNAYRDQISHVKYVTWKFYVILTVHRR